MSKTQFTVAENEKTLIVQRTFDAPKESVWEAYTNAEILARWWGPNGWETTIKHMEFTNGGYWLYGMKCVDEEQGEWFGKTSWGKGVFDNIHPEDSFEYTDIFCDEHGEPVPGMPTSHTKLTLTEENMKTTIVIRTTYDTPEALAQVLEMGMKEGFTQTWDNLDRQLSS